jgi:hypothetical protein
VNEEIEITPKDNGQVDVEVKSTGTVEVNNAQPLVSFLSIQDISKEDAERVKEVWDYFSKDSKSTSEILYNIQSRENRMGGLALNESRLDKLHRWVRITKDIENNEKLRNSL